MESKKEIYDLIPGEYYPPTVFFNSNCTENEFLETVRKIGLKFPMVGKPDIGMKGMSVKKLENENDLIDHLRKLGVISKTF